MKAPKKTEQTTKRPRCGCETAQRDPSPSKTKGSLRTIVPDRSASHSRLCQVSPRPGLSTGDSVSAAQGCAVMYRARHGLVRLRPLHTSGLAVTSAWAKNMIREASALATPKNIHVCDGSDAEAAHLIKVGSVCPRWKKKAAHLLAAGPDRVRHSGATEEATELVLGALRSAGRGASGEADLHLLAPQGGRWCVPVFLSVDVCTCIFDSMSLSALAS
jgi:hypothetical protein